MLKTLKDLKRCPNCTRPDYEDRCVRFDELKQEAIKILKADTKDLCEFLGVEELTNEKIKVIDLIIKKIFNIKEEDLK